MTNPIRYARVNVNTGADNVVTLKDCDIVFARVVTVLSAHTQDIEDGNGGTVLGQFAASAAVGTELDFRPGVRMDNGINLAGDAAATGEILVAYRETRGV